ncbi:hypothetical protein CcaCcLH18_13088 [Colletotrichum camelliae]|nr:hypothetical protein CcaCcLH18_13088 [Colletotrichum camelliae]
MVGESSRQRQETPESDNCIFVASPGFPIPARRSPLPTSAPRQAGTDNNNDTTPKETERVSSPSHCKADQEIKEEKPKDDTTHADGDEGVVVATSEIGTKEKTLLKDEGIAT